MLAVACVTTSEMTRVPSLEEKCDGGSAWACETWGQQLQVDGRLEEADRAFGLACAMGSTSACLTQGKDRLARGDLDGAEPPLRKVYDEDSEEATLALADLQDARGDQVGAAHLRYEALSIDKSTTEFAFGWRVPFDGGLGMALDVNVQPMGLKARRLTLGANLGLGPNLVSLNATVGYQHFVTNWFAPYGRALVGPYLDDSSSRRTPINLGAELGMKFFAGPIGHLGTGFGTSLDGSTYYFLEAGLDWLLTLAVLAHL
ncbi:putative lipoprotein [Corallococcus coralloides]|uniref:Putative lipoprotein n=1 Tax=Corallococcus coralloides TaxID=184914 RepID=A0A410RQM6_CORCK|nr:putative lipoprotein [Corallococcus coralloides]